MNENYTINDTLNDVPDAELVGTAQQGDKRAFVTLYRRYLQRVYRYFYARTGEVQQAEDLTAQTFVAVMESLPRYREAGMFSAWLFSIARRRYADVCRERAVVSLDSEAMEMNVDEMCDSLPLPESQVTQNEQVAELAVALRTLSPNRAQAVALHFFGGLSHKETAKAMGRTQIAVKSLIHRALQDLREVLGDGQT